MPPDRHPPATVPRASDTVRGLHASWPPRLSNGSRGYRPLDLEQMVLLDSLALDAHLAVAVVAHPSGTPAALPCRLADGSWRVAGAGDGVAAALLAALGGQSEAVSGRFSVCTFDAVPISGPERALGTDQTNTSVALGDAAIVKWRTDPRADGRRAQRWRRHLQANGFTQAPALAGSLLWTDEAGQRWVLADIDAYLPGAEDGWDFAIGTLLRAAQQDLTTSIAADDLATGFGALTAELHVALDRPSEVIEHPRRRADSDDLRAIRAAGSTTLDRALAIEAADQDEVIARAGMLRMAIERAPIDGSDLALIHGDLHVGQLVAWQGGLAVIDFDGPPEPRPPEGMHDACARDVAQAVCSLWNLAAVVDARTDGQARTRLGAWAARAEAGYLAAYRRIAASLGSDGLDERWLEPFIAEQFCRELLYAHATLPRWRYAPLQALRWRYPLDA